MLAGGLLYLLRVVNDLLCIQPCLRSELVDSA